MRNGYCEADVKVNQINAGRKPGIIQLLGEGRGLAGVLSRMKGCAVVANGSRAALALGGIWKCG